MNAVESLYQEPEKWSQCEFYMVHEGGFMVWTGNGFFFYAPYPGGQWTLLMKLRFAAARRWWSNNQPVTQPNLRH